MKKLLIILFIVMLSSSKHVNAQERNIQVIWVYSDTVTVNRPLSDRGRQVAYYDATINKWYIRDTAFLLSVLVEQVIEANEKRCPFEVNFGNKKQKHENDFYYIRKPE